MNKILLITTGGCDAYTIMANSIKQALSATSKDITFVQKDYKEVDRQFLVEKKNKRLSYNYLYKR